MKDRISRLAGSVFYIGFVPGAPGTYGSMAASAVVLALYLGGCRILPALLLSTICLITLAGVWAAAEIGRRTGVDDPSYVVIDEVAGQLTTYLFLPLNVFTIVLGFAAFRLFDIWKPYPIRKLEALEGGVGVMADDLLAGIYGNVILQVISYLIFNSGRGQ